MPYRLMSLSSNSGYIAAKDIPVARSAVAATVETNDVFMVVLMVREILPGRWSDVDDR
jgi:hypothetical protein